MMATAAVIGLHTGKRLLSSSFCQADLTEKLFPVSDHGSLSFSGGSIRCTIVAHKSSHLGPNVPPIRHIQTIKSLKEHANTSAPSTSDTRSERPDLESSLEVLILLQKSMLEKQWELPFTQMTTVVAPENSFRMPEITRSGISARERRTVSRMKCFSHTANMVPSSRAEQLHPSVSRELLQSDISGYVRGTVSENLLTHAEVANLSKRIKAGIHIQEQRTK
ncbi:hypothetical protein B296_00020339 [Ensete ventricosum]|uniref:Uncharacterized protein n=1 Tax=Ensete ventricosum TaxID=4639 RepID=A0A427B0G6_ENSVE|nr:hypothetical protein B296_00020339 [Ensete ventricosum]